MNRPNWTASISGPSSPSQGSLDRSPTQISCLSPIPGVILIATVIFCFIGPTDAIGQDKQSARQKAQSKKLAMPTAEQLATDRAQLLTELQAEYLRFNNSLDELAKTCRQQSLNDEATEVSKLIIDRDPNRQYIFSPPSLVAEPHVDTESQKQFRESLNQLKKEHADKLFEQAEWAIEQSLASDAYQLLHEVLVYDPKHERARSILGFRLMEKAGEQSEWVRSKRGTFARLSNTKQKTIGWERKTYWQIESPHFKIYSAAGEQNGLELAAELERTYWIWRQVFFSYWCSSRKLKAWFDGKGSDPTTSRRYEVILFKDREHYLADLSEVPNVERSSGYYNEKQKASFFYWSDNQLERSNWRHETVHQLLQENAGNQKSVEAKGHAWLVEGVAMYFESIQEFPGQNYVTLGGFDSARLQYARLRAKREAFVVPMETLDEMDRDELMNHTEVEKLYGQAAAVSQYLFAANQGQYREGFIEFIKQFYKDRRVRTELSELTVSLDQLDRLYQEFLEIDRVEFGRYFTNRTTDGLALGRSRLNSLDIAVLAECRNLSWLELSENPIGDDALDNLQEMPNLTQLFLDVTGVTDASAEKIASIQSLQELDLASTKVTSATIEKLIALPDLKILWLAGSNVTDSCLDSLRRMPSLKLVDLRETEVTDEAVKSLQAARQSLRILK